MQLTGPEILCRMQDKPNPDIVIKPFDMRCLGSNSYDLHLADTLRVYKHTIPLGMKPAIPYDPRRPKYDYSMRDWFDSEHGYKVYKSRPELYDARNPRYMIDPTKPDDHQTIDIKIPRTGLILSPEVGYLGSTVEYTETRNLFPYIDGKSSVGRNFILNHHTAGRGDDGFCGEWTLEIRVLYPTIVYPNMRIGQIYYEEFSGNRMPYNENPHSHYNGQRGPTAAAVIPVDNFIADAKTHHR